MRFIQLLATLQNCHLMEPNEVLCASQASAIINYDMSKCRVLKEPVVMNRVAVYFRKHHYLLRAVDRKISLFKAAGLIDFWIASTNPENTKSTGGSDPKVMTFHDLSGAFRIGVYGLFLASFAFCCEIVFKCMRNVSSTYRLQSIFVGSRVQETRHSFP